LALPQVISRNVTQRFSEDTRGGLYTVVGSGGATEASISTGSLLAYSVPTGKRTRMKGTLIVTDLGTNTSIAVNVFDNTAGRLIPVAIVTAINVLVEWSAVLATSVFDITISGNDPANDGACAVLASIEELPA